MDELIPLFLICFFVGGLILWATFTGWSTAPVFTGILGVYFILLPIFLALGWTTLFALMVTLPLGFLWTVMAFFGVTAPFRFCIRREVTYIQPVFHHKHRGRSGKYYALQCRFQNGRHTRQQKSEDWYDLSSIEKKYTPNTTITIWANKKNNSEFRVRRFFGVGSYLLLFVPSIGFLGLGIKLIVDLF